MIPAHKPFNDKEMPFHFLFLFMDGIGLGANDPQTNPFARADLPNLQQLLGGKRLIQESIPEAAGRLETKRLSLLPLDACLGVAGMPQSATGQAALLTGRNISAELGYHYGPKPNPEIGAILRDGNLFKSLRENALKAALLNAYPPRYFQAIESGKRLYSAIPLAVASAGIPLRTQTDLIQGRALSADFTAEGWRTQLGFQDTPVLTPLQAGKRLVALASELDFSLFEYWPSDYAGHGQDMQQACTLLETFDQVLGGLLEAWQDDEGIILITSDHGNLEDLGTRRHTLNTVPALVIGAPEKRRLFTTSLADLTGITPAILRCLGLKN